MSTVVARPKRAQEKEARETPTILRFTEDHLWVRSEAEAVQIGLSDYGQAHLGEIIAVELPEVGERIERGSPFGELESVRTVRELVAPVTAIVAAVNQDVDEHPELVNEGPYHDGWLIEVALPDESELDDLMPAEEYEESTAEEE